MKRRISLNLLIRLLTKNFKIVVYLDRYILFKWQNDLNQSADLNYLIKIHSYPDYSLQRLEKMI